MKWRLKWAAMMKGSNYESPVIGYDGDILSFTLEETIQFHETYYSPRNSYLVLTGDMDIDKSLMMIEKYFVPHISKTLFASLVIYTFMLLAYTCFDAPKNILEPT